MSERTPIYGDPATQEYVVTLLNRMLVRCHVEMIGEEGSDPAVMRPRWIFETIRHGQPSRHIGPLYEPIQYVDDVFELAQRWAQSTGLLGRMDWVIVDAMTDEEVERRALDDPDSQSLSDEQLASMRTVPGLPKK